ncbi:MAG TPA: hypothetical protein VKA86_15575 [Candidatus Krumholzibacteria bacterium]|nr:hypothetical protein [Candidatus Krumholzibacteria bacterium]
MIQRGRHSRLEAVARTYLDADAPRSRLIVVAGEDPGSTAHAARAVQQAASDMNLPSVLLSRGTETVDLELGHDRTQPLVVYHHGPVRESQLARLRPASADEPGPDLLLWDLPRPGAVGLRSTYLLGLLTWSLGPRQVRCLLPPAGDDGPPLSEVRAVAREAFESVETAPRPELLQRPGAWSTPDTRGLLGQVLQSMLAGARRSGQRRSVRRNGLRAQAGSWLLAVGLAAAAAAPVGAQDTTATDAAPALVTVEVHGVDLDDARTHRRPDGTRLSWAAEHLLRLEPGVGTRSEGAVSFTTERTRLFAREGEEPLDWTPRERSIARPLLLDAREFTLLARSGDYAVTPESIVVTLPERSSVLPGRQGLIVTGVMLVMIVLLFWRASSVRRRLDRPYESVRRRRRPED